MALEFLVLVLSIIITGLLVWIVASKFYQKRLIDLESENSSLKAQIGLNQSIINEVKVEFSKIAQESLKNQQEALLSEHSKDLESKLDLFKVQDIDPINRLLKDFKDSIEKYQESHKEESFEIKNAIATAEKYAKALTMNQNSKGEFGEDLLEQILNFANLQENVHYSKQYVADGVKPDFVVKLPNEKSLIIDSKVILKNYIEYRQADDDKSFKKAFIDDVSRCISALAKKDYENIDGLNQPDFILMYVPIETCLNMIYTDLDCRKLLEQANESNIIIVGNASLLVSLRLVKQLWANQIQYENVKNIITVGENLYNNISTHAQNLLNIKKAIDNAAKDFETEMNRFTSRHNGSIFKEAEKLKDFGISSKEKSTGKKIVEKGIPQSFLEENIENNN